MRITNKIITTKYMKSLNDLSVELNRLSNQVTTGRKFNRSSENTAAAIKAYQIRRDLSKVDGYQANIEYAKSSLTNAESALSHIEELVQSATVQILTGMNGPHSNAERKIIASQLRNIQDQMFQTLNSNFSDAYCFGGTNTNNKPFEIIDGKLHYNGYNLDSPLPSGTEDENKAIFRMLENNTQYIDIGYNVKFDQATGEIDNSTVFGYSIAGISIVGSGTCKVDGVAGAVSNNLHNLLGRIADEFESPDYSFDKVDSLYKHYSKISSNVLNCITNIGSKTSYLDFMSEKLGDLYLNMQERQLSVEGADPAETIIRFETQKVAYTAALQMGSRIIQQSIFDFIS